MCYLCAADAGYCEYCGRPVCFDRQEDVPGEKIGAACITVEGLTACQQCRTLVDASYRAKGNAAEGEPLDWYPPGHGPEERNG